VDKDHGGGKLRHARMSTAVVFFYQGLIIASWASRIPAVKAAAGLSDGPFGLALLGAPLASIAVMRPAAKIIARHGSRGLIRASVIANVAAMILLATARNGASLAVALAVLGSVGGTLGIGMNAQGVQIERRYGRPLMIGFHAGYSFGGLAGALLGSAAARSGYSPLRHLALTAIISAALCLAASRWLVTAAEQPPAPGSQSSAVRLLRDTPVLWVLAAIVFCMLLSEAAMADWSALYMRDTLGTTAGTAALAYAGFSLMEAVSRLGGNRVIARLGAVATVRAGAALAAVSLAIALLVPSPVVAIAGFGFFGFGMAAIAPIAFSAAGNKPGIPSSSALARVMSVGYTGIFVGPAMIGVVAQAAGLTVALGIPAALVACIVVLSPAVRGARDGSQNAAAPSYAVSGSVHSREGS
jgi:predicted MFS family arabinose efflux permease